MMAAAERTGDLETAEMRTEEHATAALFCNIQQDFLAMHGNLERFRLLAEQKYPVEQAPREGEEMRETLAEAGWTFKHAAQIGL